MPPEPEAIGREVVRWQRRCGRHDLPWQGRRSAYEVWVSEIMLQQTQVQTVIGYYDRFLARFPNVLQLAQATLDEVLAHWSGLGYYRRARNLHACAQSVCRQFGGVFPTRSEVLESLPGIGRSTAAAIAAFVSGERAAILDGNVRRVLCRVFCVEEDPSHALTNRHLWDLAQRCLPPEGEDMVAWTQGIMDLGATVCTRSRPRCEECPLTGVCLARSRGLADRLPRTQRSANVRQRRLALLMIAREGRVLLGRRSAQGIWGGLWSLPEIELEDEESIEGALGRVTPELAAITRSSRWVRALPPETHRLTHQRLELVPVLLALDACERVALPEEDWQWVLPTAPTARELGLPRPIARLLARPGFRDECDALRSDRPRSSG